MLTGVGVIAFAAGAGLIHVGAGLMALGVALILVGVRGNFAGG